MKLSYFATAYGSKTLRSEIVIDVCDPATMFKDATQNPEISLQFIKGDSANTFALSSAGFKLAPADDALFCATNITLENQTGGAFSGSGVSITTSDVLTGEMTIDTSTVGYKEVYLTARKGTNVMRRSIVRISICSPIITGTPADSMDETNSNEKLYSLTNYYTSPVTYENGFTCPNPPPLTFGLFNDLAGTSAWTETTRVAIVNSNLVVYRSTPFTRNMYVKIMMGSSSAIVKSTVTVCSAVGSADEWLNPAT